MKASIKLLIFTFLHTYYSFFKQIWKSERLQVLTETSAVSLLTMLNQQNGKTELNHHVNR